MTNYFNIVNTILQVAEKHQFVSETHYGDIFEFLNSGDHKYINCTLVEQSGSQFNEDFTTLNFVLYVTDRLDESGSNLLEVHSVTKTISEQILDEIIKENPEWTVTSESFTPFKWKFSDLCAGVFINLTIQVPAEMFCEEDSFDYKTLTITKNGTYDVFGYDKASVNVSQTPTQSKNVEISIEPGKTITETILPDKGYTLSSVNVEITASEQEMVINMDSGISFKGSTWNTFPYKLVGGSNRDSFTGALSEMNNLTELDVRNIDFSNAMSVDGLFQYNTSIQKIEGLETLNFANSRQINGVLQGIQLLGSIDISKWNIPKAETISWLFGYSRFDTINVGFSNTSSFQDLGGTFSYLNCENIIGLNSWNTDNVTVLAYTFDHFSIRNAEKRLDLSNWTTPNLQTLNSFMQNDSTNEDMPIWVDIHNLNCSQVYDTYATFEQATRLTTIIGDHSIEEVENGSITALKGLQMDIDLSSTNLERPSLLAVIKGVAEGSHTLSLGSLKSRLTEADIQLATNKGWTIN